MKKLLYFSVALFAISLLACQDGKDEAKNITDLSYYRNIGKRIPTQTAYRWMDVFRTENRLVSREKPLGYALSKENLAVLSSSVDNLVGVAFQHATDEAGEHHFLIIPVDETLKIWSGSSKTIIDANTNAPIAANIARQWADTYENNNQDAIWFHFFGKHVFDEISTISFFEYVQIEPAISDENFKPQVLLIINDLSVEVSSGRGEYESAVVYDVSSPCPPCPLAEE